MTATDTHCPKCGKVNVYADDEGATDGPRCFHAECWATLTDAEQTAAWKQHDE